jgi:hypothetical protein
MGGPVWVSKQDWQNFLKRTWLGGCKPTFDELMRALDGFRPAAGDGDATTLIASTSDGGALRRAAEAAVRAAERAETGAEVLRLAGTQRWSASRDAIISSDAAISAVSTYAGASTALSKSIVRELTSQLATVGTDTPQIASDLSDDVARQIVAEREKVRAAFEDAGEKVAQMAAIDRIDQ